MDIHNYQSLIHPINLYFFFEKYKQGNKDAIITRFSDPNNPNKLSYLQIDGIYQYMQFLVDKQIVSGSLADKQADYQSYSSFGALMSQAISKSMS
jgi:hypothetical protein